MDITTDLRWKREMYSRIYSRGFRGDSKPQGVQKAKKKQGWVVVDASPDHGYIGDNLLVVFSMTN